MSDETPETQFRRWLENHQRAVFKVARAYTLTVEDYQDLVQEILLQVWCSLPQFGEKASTATWCYRVALNTALNWRRKEHRRILSHQPIQEWDVPVVNSAGEQDSDQRELIERLYAAIRQLPKTDAALVLLYLDDLSYAQMSEVLGITEVNVGVKLNRARKALAEFMKETTR